MARVVVPLPALDFDPSEVAVGWKILVSRGHAVVFATPGGRPAKADPVMVTGRGLDPWSELPFIGRLKLLGLLLRANRDARRAHLEMIGDPAYRAPMRWADLYVEEYDGLYLGGGHRARGMRSYLESPVLQRLVASFFAADKPVAAVCHGVLLAARSRRADGLSVLHGRRTTSLTWKQERTASLLAHIGRFWDPDYYRTYPEEPGQPPGHMSVEREVTRALEKPEDFRDVAPGAPSFLRKTLGLWRDTIEDPRPAFVVEDGNYLSARWPGDVHTFAGRFADLLEARSRRE
ncbi:type 1 glutamine amidotransferase domain-containing protein [Pinisolibacter sp.]|uniref:type 1 glutamine amidotransferase domain-containing protein n=1 Tax=Pinisolibacter sp. TaxID=2172024 RepID=UPI002FDEC86A